MNSKIQIIIDLMNEFSINIEDIQKHLNNPINKIIAKPSKQLLWGDMDDDEEFEPKNIEKIEKPSESSVKIIETIIDETIDNVIENTIKAVIHHNPNKGWNSVVLNNVEEFKVMKKNNKKTKPTIYTVSEYCDMIKNQKKLYKDFLIDSNSICEHTYEGTLCPNVRQCGKIHIKRCLYQDKCVNIKHCTYIHSKDMKSECAKTNYYNTMKKYLEINAKKN
jgi:hypothetical protein